MFPPAAAKTTTIADASGTSSIENNVFDSETARVRLGYALDNILLYGTAGLAWSSNQYIRTQLAGTLNIATPGTDEAVNKYLSGWTAGGGVAFAFAQNWNAFAEYRYTNFGSSTLRAAVFADRHEFEDRPERDRCRGELQIRFERACRVRVPPRYQLRGDPRPAPLLRRRRVLQPYRLDRHLRRHRWRLWLGAFERRPDGRSGNSAGPLRVMAWQARFPGSSLAAIINSTISWSAPKPIGRGATCSATVRQASLDLRRLRHLPGRTVHDFHNDQGLRLGSRTYRLRGRSLPGLGTGGWAWGDPWTATLCSDLRRSSPTAAASGWTAGGGSTTPLPTMSSGVSNIATPILGRRVSSTSPTNSGESGNKVTISDVRAGLAYKFGG